MHYINIWEEVGEGWGEATPGIVLIAKTPRNLPLPRARKLIFSN